MRGHLYEMAGDLESARRYYLAAAGKTASIPERNYQTTKAATVGERIVLAPALVWGLATLLGGVFVAVAFWFVHCSPRRTRDANSSPSPSASKISIDRAWMPKARDSCARSACAISTRQGPTRRVCCGSVTTPKRT